MPRNIDIFSQIKQLANDASARAEQASGPIGELQAYILETFGQNGLYAAYLVLAAMIVLLFSKLVGLTFSALKYMVIPAVILAFLATFFSPYSFFTALPVTVTACSLFMLFKG